MYKGICFAIASMLLSGGCATIVSGSTQEVTFKTKPAGATVEIGGVGKGSTPLTLMLKRKDTHDVRFVLEGYEPYAVLIKRSMNGWVFGNILLGGMIGLGIDFATGAVYSLTPETLDVALDGSLSTTEVMDGSTSGLIVYVGLIPSDAGLQRIGQLERSK